MKLFNGLKVSFILFTGVLICLGACQKVNQDDGSTTSGADETGRVEAGNYTILDTRTDLVDMARAKQNAEDAIIKYPELDCMVGLWAYNPPAILSALADANKLGEIAVVGFDEDEDTLQGIKDGHVVGTVVQQPYKFGYEATRILTELAKGNESVLPEDRVIEVPVKVIKPDNVDTFQAELQELLAQGENAVQPADTEYEFAFITNNTADFWTIARAGINKAMSEFGVYVNFLMPADGSASDQQRLIQSMMAKQIDGMSICPNDPENQRQLLNEVADMMPLITHDSDAPESDRLCYVGTNNYLGGREVGKLVKEALPDGGEVMIFVGRMDILNAIERRQGVIDELKGIPVEQGLQEL